MIILLIMTEKMLQHISHKSYFLEIFIVVKFSIIIRKLLFHFLNLSMKINVRLLNRS